MGDRTDVRLQIPIKLKDQAELLFDYDAESEEDIGDGLIEYLFDQVNYGELKFLIDLRKAGIPYNSSWNSGSEFSEGTEYFRFLPDGTSEFKTIYDSDRNPNLDSLIRLLDKPQELVKYIQIHIEHLSVLPWDNQLDYAKIYLTAKLINPD